MESTVVSENMSETSNSTLFEEECSQMPTTGAIALLILQLLIAISGFSANCLVVIATFTKFSCKKASNLFVCTLAIIDSLSLLGDFVGLGIQFCGDSESCEFRGCMMRSAGTTLTLISAANLALIALDRFIFIEKPFHYFSVVEKYKHLWVCVILVAPAIGLTVLYYIAFCSNASGYGMSDTLLYMVPGSSLLLISLASTVVMYTVVFATARNQQRRMNMRMQQANASHAGLPNDMHGLDSKQRRIVIGYVTIVGVFICTVTLIVVSGVTHALGCEPLWLTTIIPVAMTINSACNPFIYYFTNKEYRDHFWAMLECHKDAEIFIDVPDAKMESKRSIKKSKKSGCNKQTGDLQAASVYSNNRQQRGTVPFIFQDTPQDISGGDTCAAAEV